MLNSNIFPTTNICNNFFHRKICMAGFGRNFPLNMVENTKEIYKQLNLIPFIVLTSKLPNITLLSDQNRKNRGRTEVKRKRKSTNSLTSKKSSMDSSLKDAARPTQDKQLLAQLHQHPASPPSKPGQPISEHAQNLRDAQAKNPFTRRLRN